MHRLLDAVYLVALLVLSPWLLWRAVRTRRYRAGLRAKLFGLSPCHPVTQSPCHGCVWFHGVSVGEVHMLRQLVAAFRRRHPDRAVVVSSSTDTGLAEAKKAFPALVVFPFPFDFSWAVRRTLRRLRPALVVLAESELWPNFLLAARRLRIPVAVVNGRMSPRTLARYRLVAPLARWLFRMPDLLVVQTDEYAANVLSLGAVPGRVCVTGNIKYDGVLTDPENPRTAELRHLFGVTGDDLVWVAGSTQSPEEDVVLRIYDRARQQHPNLRLFLVPRQKDRFDEVARLIEKTGLPFVRRTYLAGPSPLVFVDTIGELGPLWGLADVAFVGGSLDGKRGGQNMIEPAAFGAAVTFGPHVWNFKDPARRLIEGSAAYQVGDAEELEAVTLRLLADAEERRSAGALARAFVLRQQGATQRTLDALEKVLSSDPQGKAA